MAAFAAMWVRRLASNHRVAQCQAQGLQGGLSLAQGGSLGLTARWPDVIYFTLIVPVNWRGLEIGLWGRVRFLLAGAFCVGIVLRGEVLEARKPHALAPLSPDSDIAGGPSWGNSRKP